MHGHLSDLTININRGANVQDEKLLFYLSTEPIVDENGNVDFDHLDKKTVRTIDIQPTENLYLTTYLHPGNYYITMFSDKDNNAFPSSGDIVNVSKAISVTPENQLSTEIEVDFLIP